MGHLLVAARRVTSADRIAVVKSLRKMLPNPLTDTEFYFRETERARDHLQWIGQRRAVKDREPRRVKKRKPRKAFVVKMSLGELEDRLGRLLGSNAALVMGQPTRIRLETRAD